MKKHRKLLIIVPLLVLFFACKKDDAPVAVVAGFTVSSSVNIDDVVSFKNESKEATNYEWSFGDGNTSTEKDPKHTFLVEGEYIVRLIASNGQTKDSIEKSITVIDPSIKLPAYTSGQMSFWGSYEGSPNNNMDLRLYTGVDDDLTDQVLWLEMFISGIQNFDNGIYTFNKTQDILTFDNGTYGPRISADYNAEQGHTKITGGTVTMLRDGADYTITIDVKDEKGQRIKGSYTGTLEYLDKTI